MILYDFKPTKYNKLKPLFIGLLLIIIYLLSTKYFAIHLNIRMFNYIFKPLLWIILSIYIMNLRKVRFKGLMRYYSTIIYWSFNFSIMYIIVLIFAGVIDGFGKSPYDHSLTGIILNLFLVLTTLFGRELARSYMTNVLVKKESILKFLIISLFFTLISLDLNSYFKLNSLKSIVIFFAKDFAPTLSSNLLASYLVFLGGPLSSILYLGIIDVFHWLSPILPNLKWITQGLVGILFPIFCFMFMQSFYFKMKRFYKKREEESILSWIFTSILSILIIWFSVGVFPIYPSVIATGSMEPIIKPGDIIIVNKNIKTDLDIGDIIQFRKDNILISHRIIDIIEEENTKKYITKGDNNTIKDSDPVSPEQIKGKVVKVVPKLGWPTLLIKSRNEIPIEQVEF